ncbi:MAG: class I SAM-dependent methyltransferase [Anaerolineae bacterium]|nr:class I SAM-dependent methyltransferase [Anaerolineae bacterium]
MTPPAFFDKFAKFYDPLTHLYMFGTYKAVRKRILKLHREEGQEVLDICCGTGYISNNVSAQRVVGIDLSIPMLRINQRNQRRAGSGAHLLNGNIRKLPFGNTHFNEVYFTLAAHEFPDLSDVLREVYRVMKPGGQLVIYDLFEPPNPLFRLFLHTFFYYVVEQQCMWVYTLEGWQDLLEQIGFRMTSLEAPYGWSALICATK